MPSADSAPLTTRPAGLVSFSAVILPLATVIFSGSEGLMVLVPNAGLAVIAATGRTMALETTAELAGAEAGAPLEATAPLDAAPEATGADDAAPAAGMVTDVEFGAAPTVELTVTVFTAFELDEVQAAAANPTAASRATSPALRMGRSASDHLHVNHPILVRLVEETAPSRRVRCRAPRSSAVAPGASLSR